MKDKVDLAGVIVQMNYGELREVGRAFKVMTDEEDVWDLRNPADWASMFFDWAESTIEENKE